MLSEDKGGRKVRQQLLTNDGRKDKARLSIFGTDRNSAVIHPMLTK